MAMITVFSQSEVFLTLCGIFILGICLYCLWSLLVSPRFSPLRHLPSPDQGSVWLRLLHEPRVAEIEHWIDEIPNGGLLRYHGLFNRERIFIASPESAKDFLTTSAYKFAKHELQRMLAQNVAGRGLLILEGDEHKQARKQFNPTFSPAQMKKWVPSLWKTTTGTLEVLGGQVEETGATQSVDSIDSTVSGISSILKVVSAASLDMIGHFGFNVDFNSLKNVNAPRRTGATVSKDPKARFSRPFIEMFKATKRGQLTLEAVSILGPNIALRLPFPVVKTIAGIMELVRDTAQDVVASHEDALANEEKRVFAQDDMLSLLMKSGHFSHKNLVEQTVHFFAAGTETTAATVAWAIHLLSRHPDMQTRLRCEIREHVPSPYMSPTDSVSDIQLHSLTYLNAVIKEVLRYHSINTLMWRECIEPATVVGVPIPKGTNVVFSPWTLNRDPAHWGPTARLFDPERWLKNPSGGADHPYSYLTFGGGPRRCVGERYAWDELLCLVAGLVGRFEITPLAPQMESDDGHELGDCAAFTPFKIYDGWKVNIKKIPGW